MQSEGEHLLTRCVQATSCAQARGDLARWLIAKVLNCLFPAPQVIGNKWDTYLDLLQAEYSEG
jgi:hypothetical protein